MRKPQPKSKSKTKPSAKTAPPPELKTVRDFLRWAVSRFTEAGLFFGHGATSALDDAAYLILETLRLPIDVLDPFLDARLTLDERARLAAAIETRVRTRKPTPYIVGKAYIGDLAFRCDERVLVPRSYLGELLREGKLTGGEDGAPAMPDSIESVLELCTGSGCLAIMAALSLPDATVDATDISAEALDVARANVADYGLEDRVRLLKGDLYKPVKGRTYDLILANPPYVDAEGMAHLPPEYRAEPALALDGGEDGLELVRPIVTGAAKHLNPGGLLVCEIGRGRAALEEAFPDLPFAWLDTEESRGEVFWIGAAALRS